MTDQVPVDEMNDASLTREAIRDELGAQNAYDAYASNTSDEHAKDVYEDIKREEGVHAGELAQVLSEQDSNAKKDMTEGVEEAKTMKSFRDIYSERRDAVLDKAGFKKGETDRKELRNNKDLKTARRMGLTGDEEKESEKPESKRIPSDDKVGLPSWASSGPNSKKQPDKPIHGEDDRKHQHKRGKAYRSNDQFSGDPWDNKESMQRRAEEKKEQASKPIKKAGVEERAKLLDRKVHPKLKGLLRRALGAEQSGYPSRPEKGRVPDNPIDYFEQFRHTDEFKEEDKLPKGRKWPLNFLQAGGSMAMSHPIPIPMKDENGNTVMEKRVVRKPAPLPEREEPYTQDEMSAIRAKMPNGGFVTEIVERPVIRYFYPVRMTGEGKDTQHAQTLYGFLATKWFPNARNPVYPDKKGAWLPVGMTLDEKGRPLKELREALLKGEDPEGLGMRVVFRPRQEGVWTSADTEGLYDNVMDAVRNALPDSETVSFTGPDGKDTMEMAVTNAMTDSVRAQDIAKEVLDSSRPDSPFSKWVNGLREQESAWKEQGWRHDLNWRVDTQKKQYVFNMPYFLPGTEQVDTSKAGHVVRVPFALVDAWEDALSKQTYKDERRRLREGRVQDEEEAVRAKDESEKYENFRNALVKELMKASEKNGTPISLEDAEYEVRAFLDDPETNEEELRYDLAEMGYDVLPKDMREKMYDHQWDARMKDPSFRERMIQSGVVYNGPFTGGYNPEVFTNAQQQVKDETELGRTLQDVRGVHNEANRSWDTSEKGRRYNELLQGLSGMTPEFQVFHDRDGKVRIVGKDGIDITNEIRGMVEPNIDRTKVDTGTLEDALSIGDDPIKQLRYLLKESQKKDRQSFESGDKRIEDASAVQSELDTRYGTGPQADEEEMRRRNKAELRKEYLRRGDNNPVRSAVKPVYDRILEEHAKEYAEKNGVDIKNIPTHVVKDLRQSSLNEALEEYMDTDDGRDFTAKRLGQEYSITHNIDAEPVEVSDKGDISRKEEEKERKIAEKERTDNERDRIDEKKKTLGDSPRDTLKDIALDAKRPEGETKRPKVKTPKKRKVEETADKKSKEDELKVSYDEQIPESEGEGEVKEKVTITPASVDEEIEESKKSDSFRDVFDRHRTGVMNKYRGI